MLKRLLIAVCTGGLFGCGSASKSDSRARSEFEPGQVWTYRHRPGESQSRVVICKVESHEKLGEIVHLQVQGLQLKNRRVAGGISHELGHLPYSSEALRKSLVNLEARNAELPSFQEGYDEWRSAVDRDGAGVWSIELAEAIDALEATINR